MGQSLLNISMITKESLRILKNELGFAKNVNRQYDDKFEHSGAKIGSVINIRKPVRYTVSDGPALQLQDIEDQSEALTLDSQKHVAFQFSSKELALNIEEFSERYIKPAVVSLANKIDYDGTGLFEDVYQAVGTPGTTPDDLDDALNAGVKLDNMGAPMDDQRSLVLNPAAQADMVYGLKGLFQSSEEIKKQYEKGVMGYAAGFKWKMDQNIRSHTIGQQGGTPEVKTTVSSQGASTIATEGWTSSAANRLKKGDVFTVAGVYAVNPQSRQSTGQLQQFVVTADFDSDGSGEGDISVAPAMYTEGPYQNITAFPADGDAITVLGSGSVVSPQNLAFHKDAFVLGMADLPLPGGVDMAARASDEGSGLSVRIVKAYDINNDTFPCRLDVLYGWKTIYPELACRIVG